MNPDKLHPRLQAALEVRARAITAQAERRLPVIVCFHHPDHDVTAAVTSARHRFRLLPALAVEANRQEIEALTEEEAVALVWLDEEVRTCLDTSVPGIQVPAVWDVGLTGEGIVIAVVDTGIDPDHPDLAGRVLDMADFTGDGPRDRDGHGTHVASIAAGTGQASGGRYRGVAPRATILSAKVLRSSTAPGRMSDVMAGIEWAVAQGAQVINLSLGGTGPCDGTDALSLMCDAAAERGVVICAAAGNDGPAWRTVGSPGCARSVITVGASDREDRVADFSSRGPTADGRVKPDVVFPGVGIVAARAANTSMGTPLDERYTRASGTSMATPHATGTAALLLQANPGLTPAQIKRAFQESAVDLNFNPDTQGAGRVDAFEAYQLATREPAPTPDPTPPPEPPQAPASDRASRDALPGCLGRLFQALGWK